MFKRQKGGEGGGESRKEVAQLTSCSVIVKCSNTVKWEQEDSLICVDEE